MNREGAKAQGIYFFTAKALRREGMELLNRKGAEARRNGITEPQRS
ncbi:MAG: hypothetical protein JW798_15500 [Prolixibacteraceae bacterium]|nr:hypothetical protein [Prolixibacteraceae bacterium]